MFKIRNSDLIKDALDGCFDAIGHGCNCFCNMGKGVAVPIRRAWPGAYKADSTTGKGSRSKLGSFSKFETLAQGKPFTVYNMYTQYEYGSGDLFTTGRLKSSLEKVAEDMNYTGVLGVPLIGGVWGRATKKILLPLCNP